LLLRRAAFHRRRTCSRAAATASAASATRSLLQFARYTLRLWLRLRLIGTRWSLLLLRKWRTRTASLLLFLRTLTLAAPLLAVALRSITRWPIVSRAGTLRLRALRIGTLTIGARSAVVLAASLSCALLVLANLLLHEPPRLLIQLRADLVVAAVRAALPSFGIGLLTAGAEDGFREWHR
jgi:hypothetical protein